VGFGSYHYKYASGREGDWMLTGFSPRAQNSTLYIMDGFTAYGRLLKKLGKHKPGKSCLYVKNLDDVDLNVLRSLIHQSVKNKSRNPSFMHGTEMPTTGRRWKTSMRSPIVPDPITADA
jgi:hypothetical protein